MFYIAAGFASLATCILAQTSSPAGPSRTYVPTSRTVQPAATSLPVVSLWLPMGAPERLQASVVSASPNQTVFALDCIGNAIASGCGDGEPITVTEGESTLIFTHTYSGSSQTAGTVSPLTMQCALVGAHLDESLVAGATSAVCVSSSNIPGLGIVVSTSTLASKEISYVPVTITAGNEKILAVSTMTTVPTNSASRGGAPAATAVAGLRLGGLLGIAVLAIT